MSLGRLLAVVAVLVLAPAAASAQSSPGFVPYAPLTAAQLNAAFQSKLDYANAPPTSLFGNLTSSPANPSFAPLPPCSGGASALNFAPPNLGCNNVLVNANTWTATQSFAASTTSAPSINIAPGVAPITPTNGDLWASAGGLFTEVNGAAVNLSSQPAQKVSVPSYGLVTLGDSITVGFGNLQPAVSGYVALMNTDFVAGISTTTNDGVAGNRAGDVSDDIFKDLNPADTDNPIVTMMVGTNDASTNAAQGVIFQQFEGAAAARASISATNTIAGSSSLLAKSGTWSNDTTYANLTGTISTTNNSTLTFATANTPAGVFYLYYRVFNTGGSVTGGGFTVAVDGVAVADTITGSTSLTTLPFGGATYTTEGGLTSVPAVARFVVTPGVHSIVVTVTSATAAANPVAILGLGIPNGQVGGQTGPVMFMAGTPYQLNNASATATAAMNGLTQSLSATLIGDGLNLRFVNIRQYINSTTDMAGTATQNCLASTSPGLHPNNCGHRHLAQAFEDAIGAASAVPQTQVTLANLTSPATLNLQNGQTIDPGTAIPAGGWCVSAFLQFCWGESFAFSSSTYYNLLTANTSQGAIGFSFTPASATFSQVVSGITFKFFASGAFNLGANINGTAAGQFTAQIQGSPTNIAGYHQLTGSTLTNSALASGVDIGGAGFRGGVQMLWDATHSIYAVGDYAPDNVNICNFFYTHSTTPTVPSNFSCPEYGTSTGLFVSAYSRTTPATVSGLSTVDAAPSDGDSAYVTDATACVFNTAVTGSGSVHCRVHYDGSSSSWKAG